jgi:hypothetical protein
MLMQSHSYDGSPDEPGHGAGRDWRSADAPGRGFEPPVADATAVQVVAG